MRFGPVPTPDAAGAYLAHAVRAGALTLRKGRLLTEQDCRALGAAGVEAVIVARLEPGDVHEDAAAARLASALAGPGLRAAAPFTGRVNLFADAAGLLTPDRARLDAVNAAHESVTVATLPEWARVEPGQMVATIKIIPFAAPATALAAAIGLAADGPPALALAPFRPLTAALIQTELPAVKASVLDKTVVVTRERLASLGGTLVDETRCGHETAALAAAIRAAPLVDLLLIAGASAVTDRQDVLPAAIIAAGGSVEHLGMPVDPGNLLVFGRTAAGGPAIGLPGCARSPKLNGFDWVLERLAARLPLGRRDIMAMGVGGLLAEIPGRPLPRAEAMAQAPRIAALVLAAGLSRRMGAANKLLLAVEGRPMVRRVVERVLESRARPVLVVTGHEGESVAAALAGLDIRLIANPAHAEGLGRSLATGMAALPAEALDGVLVCLGDMPAVGPAEIDRLIAAFAPSEGRAICVPVHDGRRGNPVLFDRRFFVSLAAAAGDTGARHVLAAHPDLVVEVDMPGAAVLTDIDTPEALAAFRAAAPAQSSGEDG